MIIVTANRDRSGKVYILVEMKKYVDVGKTFGLIKSDKKRLENYPFLAKKSDCGLRMYKIKRK